MSTAASAMRPSASAGGTASVSANMAWFIGRYKTSPANWSAARVGSSNGVSVVL